MNDPMEGFYRPSVLLKSHRDADRIMAKSVDMKTTIGIACFSESKEIELMWAHYAGNYSGICVGYATKRLQNRLGDKTRLVKVAYGDTMPLLTASETKDLEAAARIILSHKKMNWFYEREWRVLGLKGKNEITKRSTRLISNLYLGSRIDPAHESMIFNDLNLSGIPIYKMTVDGYAHKWKLLKKAPRV
jgi:hypothetical protein